MYADLQPLPNWLLYIFFIFVFLSLQYLEKSARLIVYTNEEESNMAKVETEAKRTARKAREAKELERRQAQLSKKHPKGYL